MDSKKADTAATWTGVGLGLLSLYGVYTIWSRRKNKKEARRSGARAPMKTKHDAGTRKDETSVTIGNYRVKELRSRKYKGVELVQLPVSGQGSGETCGYEVLENNRLILAALSGSLYGDFGTALRDKNKKQKWTEDSGAWKVLMKKRHSDLGDVRKKGLDGLDVKYLVKQDTNLSSIKNVCWESYLLPHFDCSSSFAFIVGIALDKNLKVAFHLNTAGLASQKDTPNHWFGCVRYETKDGRVRYVFTDSLKKIPEGARCPQEVDIPDFIEQQKAKNRIDDPDVHAFVDKVEKALADFRSNMKS